jgi:hypothetical protein
MYAIEENGELDEEGTPRYRVSLKDQILEQ